MHDHNDLNGAGILWAALTEISPDHVTAEAVMDGGEPGNALLVKFPVVGGLSASRGYLVTVTIPD